MFHHITVMLKEAVEGLQIKSDGVFVDCTLGGGGHSSVIASKLSEQGLLIAIDQDEQALQAASERLARFADRVKLARGNFRQIRDILADQGIQEVDGILFDLGVSSPQLDEEKRGFSYHGDAPLDMRMDRNQTLTAYVIVNEWEENEIADIIRRYGEEKFAGRIAKHLVSARTKGPIETTGQLAEIVKLAIPAATRRTGPHPARRTFQAIRIAVNDELNAFAAALEESIQLLKPGGRVAVISFHSLEDRICKQVFQTYSQGCICPRDFPQCVCGHKPLLKVVTRKPILPSEEEVQKNPRARSAKLRIAEKTEDLSYAERRQ